MLFERPLPPLYALAWRILSACISGILTIYLLVQCVVVTPSDATIFSFGIFFVLADSIVFFLCLHIILRDPQTTSDREFSLIRRVFCLIYLAQTLIFILFLLPQFRVVSEFYILACIVQILFFLAGATPFILTLLDFIRDFKRRRKFAAQQPFVSVNSSALKEDWSCVICLAESEAGLVRIKNCVHVFHRPCIQNWIENYSKNNCPVCRVSIEIQEVQAADAGDIALATILVN